MPTGLVFMAQEGKMKAVKRLLSRADVHEKDEHGACALHQAAREGHVDVMKHLIATGADINARGELGRTPLMYAVENRSTCEPLRLLLSSGARVHDADDGLGAPALALAAQLGTPEAVELLLRHGADVLHADRLGMLPVHRAAQHGTVETLAMLLDHCGADSAGSLDPKHVRSTVSNVNETAGIPRQGEGLSGVPDKNGANGTDGTNGTNGMSEKEAMVNTAATTNNATPLHCAASGGKIHNVLLLLNRGAKADARMSDGSTSLHVACGTGNCPVAEVLLDNGAAVNAQKHGGFTALVTACAVADLSMSTLLMENGADVNIAGDNGWSPLHFATMKGDVELLRLLLPKCNSAAAITQQGETALYLAIKHNHLDLVPLLLAQCDVNQATAEGSTALHAAAAVGDRALVQRLVRHGATVGVCDAEGRTPLDVATRHGHAFKLEDLLQTDPDLSQMSSNRQGVETAANEEQDHEATGMRTNPGLGQAPDQRKDQPTGNGKDNPYYEKDEVLCKENRSAGDVMNQVPDVKVMETPAQETRL